MNVSEVARRSGLSPSGVRWYESVGILPKPIRRRNGYRDYTEADLSRLTFVLTLRRLGLKPETAGQIAQARFEGGVIDPELHALVVDQRRAIARQCKELLQVDMALRALETENFHVEDRKEGRRTRRG